MNIYNTFNMYSNPRELHATSKQFSEYGVKTRGIFVFPTFTKFEQLQVGDNYRHFLYFCVINEELYWDSMRQISHTTAKNTVECRYNAIKYCKILH